MEQQQQTATGMPFVAEVTTPEAAARVAAAATADADVAKVEVHNYPPSVVADVEAAVVNAWNAAPAFEKRLVKITARVAIVLAVARFLATDTHNTLVVFGQDVLRDPGVQSALAAALQGLVGS